MCVRTERKFQEKDLTKLLGIDAHICLTDGQNIHRIDAHKRNLHRKKFTSILNRGGENCISPTQLSNGREKK